ncbi:MAG TPA: hypothetical protein VNN22_24585 [Verrucomicrobiae bacterium]|nr:hypothetical protein [Verrucomicrobiae bacterium]
MIISPGLVDGIPGPASLRPEPFTAQSFFGNHLPPSVGTGRGLLAFISALLQLNLPGSGDYFSVLNGLTLAFFKDFHKRALISS